MNIEQLNLAVGVYMLACLAIGMTLGYLIGARQGIVAVHQFNTLVKQLNERIKHASK